MDQRAYYRLSKTRRVHFPRDTQIDSVWSGWKPNPSLPFATFRCTFRIDWPSNLSHWFLINFVLNRYLEDCARSHVSRLGFPCYLTLSHFVLRIVTKHLYGHFPWTFSFNSIYNKWHFISLLCDEIVSDRWSVQYSRVKWFPSNNIVSHSLSPPVIILQPVRASAKNAHKSLCHW